MNNFKHLFSVFILFLFFSSVKIVSQKKFLDISLSADFGILNGEIKEYVFSSECHNTDDVLSRLDWDVKNIPVLSIKADINIFKYVFLGYECFLSVPKASGAMQDYDWVNCIPEKDEGFGLPPEYGTELTNYSWHENYLKEYNGLEAKIGGNIFISFNSASLRITPFLAYQYDFIGFDGKNGYRTYKKEDWEKIDFKGRVISYYQETHAFLLGVDFSLSLFDFLRFSGDLQLSPATTYMETIDHHYERKLAFMDKIYGAFQLKANFCTSFCFAKNFRPFIKGYIQYIPVQKGADYATDTNNTGNFNPEYWVMQGGKGGTSRFLYEISLGCCFDLF